MTRKARKPPIAVPDEGSPADWFARGYRQGIIDGSGAATRELGNLRTHVRPVTERAAEVADLARSLAGLLDGLIEAMHLRWGRACANPADRWDLHPMYQLGLQVFEQGQDRDQSRPASDEPVAPERRHRKATTAAATDPGLPLTLDNPSPPAEPELPPEQELRRAAGRAWRA